MGARLEILSGKRQGQVVELSEGSHEVGTSKRVAVRIAERGVSYTHARLEVGPDTTTLVDLHSTAGTSVNGERLEKHSPRTLVNGDRLSFGPVETMIFL